MLKGATAQSMVYQVLWKVERMDITEINLHSQKVIPRDTGSLIVTHDEERVRIDQWRPSISIGRAPEAHVLREDLALDRSGTMSLGRSGAGRGEGVLTFAYDRRSMFRI